MATVGNEALLDLTLCGQAVSVTSNQADVDIIDLQVTKAASCSLVLLGGEVCYTVTVVNNSTVNLTGVTFRDPLASNLTYVTGSFQVDGVPEVPTISGNEIQYTFDITAGSTVTFDFCATVTGLV